MDKLIDVIRFILTFAVRTVLKGIAVWIILSSLIGMKLIAGAVAFPQCLSIGLALTVLEVNATFSERPLLEQ